MKKMSWVLTTTVLLFTTLAPFAIAQDADDMAHQGAQKMGAKGGEKHPVIRRSITQLEHVKMELQKEASHDFQGHRVQAIKSIDEAIEHLKQALTADKK